MEPTTSLWDCGGRLHCEQAGLIRPGRPLLRYCGACLLFCLATIPQMRQGAVNAMSATVSALSILFLFWTITYFAGRIILKQKTAPIRSSLYILSAGFIGSLAYAFSDSFVVRAVEGEVYALSSFFTALVFWAMLKWERRADLPIGNRWLVFIFFMLGFP